MSISALSDVMFNCLRGAEGCCCCDFGLNGLDCNSVFMVCQQVIRCSFLCEKGHEDPLAQVPLFIITKQGRSLGVMVVAGKALRLESGIVEAAV